ncbi:chitin-binding, type 1 protein [Tanacetum coccineum]
MNSFLLLTILVLLATVSAQDCGTQGIVGIAPIQCSGSGTTPSPGPGTGGGVASIVTSSMFDQMLKYRNDPRCRANGFYTYNAFINAANSFNRFGTTGSADDRKRELAAFFAQTSHETTGGWSTAPDGQFAWGYCFVREQNPTSSNYNYGLFGRTINRDLINSPDLLATDPTISFQSAIWFWMTPQGNKPSSHDVITGRWSPSAADRSAGRVSGYGVITNIINGGLECGKGRNDKVEDRIGFYRRYCSILGVGPGNNLDCYNQSPFA